MASGWIKMEKATPDKPEIMRMARILGVERDLIVGKLFRFWSWADEHCTDGVVVGVVDADVDAVVDMDGFASALKEVRWLSTDASTETLTIPNFDRHNGESAKKRNEKSLRQAKWREGRRDGSAPVDANVSTTASTREEKRREEVKPPVVPQKGDAYTPEFEAFWKTYPNRTDKAKAFKSWKRLSAEDREAALADLNKRPSQDPKWQEEGGKFVPMCSTYLNGKRWQDEWTSGATGGRSYGDL